MVNHDDKLSAGGHKDGREPKKEREFPSQVDRKLSMFDRFATSSGEFVSRAWFFMACVLIVIIWAPTFLLMPLDTWQLVINTLTTIITFCWWRCYRTPRNAPMTRSNKS